MVTSWQLAKMPVKVQTTIDNYLQSDRITRDSDQVIVPPGLGTRSGVLDAMALAIAAE